MAIVRPDRRAFAVETLAALRELHHAILAQVDMAQGALEELEIRLGLAQEPEVMARGSYGVFHSPPGSPEAHPLSECPEHGCEKAPQAAPEPQDGPIPPVVGPAPTEHDNAALAAAMAALDGDADET